MPNTVDVYMYEAYTCIVFKIEIFINELVYLPEFDFEKKNHQHCKRLSSSSQYYVQVLHVFQALTLKCFIIKSCVILPFIIHKTMIIPLPNVIVRVHKGYPNKSKRPSSHSLCLLYFLIIKRLKVLTFISLFYANATSDI